MDAAEQDLWSAIGDPTRKQLLDAMLSAPGATATSLAEELPVTRQAVAKHLAILERVGLVESRRAGREVRFSVEPRRLEGAAAAMAHAAAAWDQRLAMIKQLAEAAVEKAQTSSR